MKFFFLLHFFKAYKEGIYGRRYQWIITGIYEENWWRLNENESELLGCTETELLDAINGYISTDILPLSKNTQTYYGFVSICLSPSLLPVFIFKFFFHLKYILSKKIQFFLFVIGNFII